MASFAFLHAADLHLDSPLRGLAEDPDAPAGRIRGASRVAVQNLVALALSEGVALVLLAGDLFDGDWPDWRSGGFLAGQLRRLTAAGIEVVAIRGNHDAAAASTLALPPMPGFTLLAEDRPQTLTLPGLGLAVHGQGFATQAVTANLAASYPAPVQGLLNIGVLHSCVEDGAHERYAPCSLEQLRAHGYDYWALGHVHARRELSDDPWVVFPGNLQGRDVGETGPKGATLVRVGDGRIGSVEHRVLDDVRWHHARVALEGAEDEEQALALVRARAEEALDAAQDRLLALRLTLAGATAAHAGLARDPAGLRARVALALSAVEGPERLWLESVRLETAPATQATPLAARVDALGALARSLATAEADAAATASLREHAALLLARLPAGAQLPDDHPAVLAARGEVPASLLERARGLVLARLGEG